MGDGVAQAARVRSAHHLNELLDAILVRLFVAGGCDDEILHREVVNRRHRLFRHLLLRPNASQQAPWTDHSGGSGFPETGFYHTG